MNDTDIISLNDV